MKGGGAKSGARSSGAKPDAKPPKPPKRSAGARKRRASLAGQASPTPSTSPASGGDARVHTRPPGAPPTGSRVVRPIAVAVAALMVGFALWLLVYPSGHGPGEGAPVEIVLAPNQSASAIANELAHAGLVSSPHLFALYVSLSGGAGSIAPGKHLLSDDASPRELFARLQRRTGTGRVKVTFPEGWTRFDMARRLEEKKVCTLRAFLDATTDAGLLNELRIDGDSAEGFLFPSTYDLAPDSDASDVVRRMKAEFDRRWLALEQRYGSGILDLTMPPLKLTVRDIVTLSSLVEREAAVDDERPVIASVFLNRLRDPEFHPKLLQSDPSAGYGCLVAPELASCAGYAGKITPAINGDPENKYTTYKHEGLPPGPIANPGAKSLAAALSPATTRYLYFVARGDGSSRHTFSETYGAHTAAVQNGKH